jgi:anti-sigma B factor antagonist
MHAIHHTSASASPAPATRHQLLQLAVDMPAPATTLITVAGEIDATTAPELADTLRPHLTTQGIVLVDLSAVTFLSAIGLRVLVEAHQSTHASGGTLKLITGPRCVNRILALTDLDAVLDCYQPAGSVRRLDAQSADSNVLAMHRRG